MSISHQTTIWVPCSYKGCGQRRIHHEQPDENRPHRMVEVPEGFPEGGEVFCSYECACLAGAYDVRTGFIEKDRRKPNT